MTDEDYKRRQEEFNRTGTHYYGDGGTIHGSTILNVDESTMLDVEVHDGRVVSVWFRCAALPFRQVNVSAVRMYDMEERIYCNAMPEIHGLELKYGEKGKV